MASNSPDSRLDDLVEQVDNQLGLIRAGSSREPVGDRSWIRLAEWAARRFDEVGPSSLRAPLSAVADAVNRGVRLELALARLGEDRNADRLASILSDCARDGSPLAPALEHLAGDLRSDTRRRHHTAIGELPVRLTPPLVLCTLPAVVLIAVAPITITALRAVRAGL